jgi:hypothetical protein
VTPIERKTLMETAIALAALVEALADGVGLHELNEIRAKFREQMLPLLRELIKVEGTASSADAERT